MTDGEKKLERFHVISGVVSEDGSITLKMEVQDGERELLLSEFERVQKEDFPFTNDEYTKCVLTDFE